jgi:hypothetical protein
VKRHFIDTAELSSSISDSPGRTRVN